MCAHVWGAHAEIVAGQGVPKGEFVSAMLDAKKRGGLLEFLMMLRTVLPYRVRTFER